MSGREFQEWQVYHSLWPLGERRADLRSAIVASVIANVNRGPDAPAYSPQDFMPAFDVVDEEIDEDASIELTQNLFESLTLQLGGEIKE